MEFEDQQKQQQTEEEEAASTTPSHRSTKMPLSPQLQLEPVQLEPLQPVQHWTANKPKYKECLKNHAVSIGGHAVDGCGEFLPAGEDGSIDSLKCAACNCHRNFHRKSTTAVGAGGGEAAAPFVYYRTLPPPCGYLQYHVATHQRPLALPSTSGGVGGGYREDQEDIFNPNYSGGSGSKKRFRTKFSQEQKEKMQEVADKLGWRIQREDEELVQQLCNETGITRQVFKVWMHNNKHTLGKKP